MKIRRRAFSNLSSLLEIQGFTYPLLEKTIGEDTIVADQINGETQKAIRIRYYVPMTFKLGVGEHSETIVRKGRTVQDISFHITT